MPPKSLDTYRHYAGPTTVVVGCGGTQQPDREDPKTPVKIQPAEPTQRLPLSTPTSSCRRLHHNRPHDLGRKKISVRATAALIGGPPERAKDLAGPLVGQDLRLRVKGAIQGIRRLEFFIVLVTKFHWPRATCLVNTLIRPFTATTTTALYCSTAVCFHALLEVHPVTQSNFPE